MAAPVPEAASPVGPERLRHPHILVFLLGGLVGAGINIGVAVPAHRWLGWNPLLAIFLGTLANELFHYLYYSVVFVNQEVRWRMKGPPLLLLYLAVAAVSSGLLWIFLRIGLPYVQAVLAVLVVLSLANGLLNRIVTLASSRLAEVEYLDMEESYYDDHTDAAKVGRIRAWFHGSRFARLTAFVAEHFQAGKSISDLGCGNCLWNTQQFPVTGVDINEKMLGWAQRNRRLRDYRVAADLARTGLPEGAFDIVVMSETLEHLLRLEDVLAEVRRILKPDGLFLITVPYDFFLSPFFIMFNLHCVYQGYVKGSRYHRFRCGHINHFTKTRLRRLLEENGFRMTRVFVVNGLTLYASAEKIHGAA